MHAMGDNENITIHLIKQLMEEFKEEKIFINYFLRTWYHDETHTENMPMRQISSWFSLRKIRKKHIVLQRHYGIHQESNERVEEQEEF